MQTREEYLSEARKELGEQVYKDLYANIDNDYYSFVESEMKQGKTISKHVYDSLSDGQHYHFNKHYNHRGDRVEA